MLQLIVKDGRLYFPNGDIILVIYPEGDCDAIKWPHPNRKNLHQALFDAREVGRIKDEEVLLPDGSSAWAE